jgi:hypothetical protein
LKPANPSSGGGLCPSFAQIPAGSNSANSVLINGRYYFNDYDTPAIIFVAGLASEL